MSCILPMRAEEKNRTQVRDQDSLIILLNRMDFPGAFRESNRHNKRRGVMRLRRNSVFTAERQYRPADLD